jgi:hypothetical protein
MRKIIKSIRKWILLKVFKAQVVAVNQGFGTDYVYLIKI